MVYFLPPNARTATLRCFNDWLCNNYVPERCKVGIVCPILKPGRNTQLIENYRPIVLQSCVTKVLERMIASRLNWEVENMNLWKLFQYGFRMGRGVNEALIGLTLMLFHTLLTNKHALCTFLDIEAAYDNVNHNILTNKLLLKNISPDLTALIYNLLTYRKTKASDDPDKSHF